MPLQPLTAREATDGLTDGERHGCLDFETIYGEIFDIVSSSLKVIITVYVP